MCIKHMNILKGWWSCTYVKWRRRHVKVTNVVR